MSSRVRWSDIRADLVEQSGGEDAAEAGKQELLASAVGHRLAEVRRARELTQQVAERTGVTEGRVSQVGQSAPARYDGAVGGRLHQAVFDDGDIA